MTMHEPPNRRIPLSRWIITGELQLMSAAHFGGPNPDDRVDMVLHRDLTSGKFLLTGASIAGALRSAIEDVHSGYRTREAPQKHALFGGGRRDEEGDQSPLYVYDSTCENRKSALRDGVAINPKTGIAEDKAKFDYEVIPAGASFPLRFELHVDKDGPQEDALLSELNLVLSLLEEGEIPLGAKKTRGLGSCRGVNWKLRRFDLTSTKGWEEWLMCVDQVPLANIPAQPTLAAAFNACGYQPKPLATDLREFFAIATDVAIDGSMLIRSSGRQAGDPDMAHLSENGQRLVPGTSLAGVFRGQCSRILCLLGTTDQSAEKVVQGMFGTNRQETRPEKVNASRLRTMETFIHEDSVDLIIHRIRTDRFTGGVVDGALFDQKPVFGGKFRIELRLVDPHPHEKGLLLLLLKDLLTGVISIGGERSVGRGWLKPAGPVELLDMVQGRKVSLSWNPNESASSDLQQKLNGMIASLHTFLEKGAPA